MPYIGNIVQDFSVNTAMLNTDSVTSIKIDDGTIVNADINDSAAIAMSKLALSITNSEINASAAIAGSKISPNFGSQAVTGGHSTFQNLTALGLTLSHTNASINFTDSNNNPDYAVIVDGGVFDLNSVTPAVNIIKINTDGHIDVGTNVDFAAGIDITGAITGTTSLIGATTYGGGGAAPALYVSNTGGRQVKIHNPNAGTSSLQITNATTGQGEDAGTQLFTQATTGDFHTVNKFVTGDIAFTTTVSGPTSGERLRITADGDVTFGIQSGGGSPNASTQIRHFDFGRDHWNSTAGDYRALRLKVYHASNDDVYGIGISGNLLEIQSQQNIGFFAGSAGGGTGQRVERVRITDSLLEVQNPTKVKVNNAVAPESHAQLNIGSTGTSETRAIDIDGSWLAGENKSISFTHGGNAADIVGQINSVHNSPGSSLRFGKLYHGGNSTAYTMTLDSTSTTGADLTLHDGNLIFADGHGINFQNVSGSDGGSTSALLDDYEEGTWTASISSGTVNNIGTQSGRSFKYRKVGGLVTFCFDFFKSASNMEIDGNIVIDGLPFATYPDQFHSHLSVSTYQSNGGSFLIKNYIDNNGNIVIHDNGTISNIRHFWGQGFFYTT